MGVERNESMKEPSEDNQEPGAPATKRGKKHYDAGFRRNAVALVQSSGRPLKEIAVELGVSYWNLRDWSQSHRRSSVPAANSAEMQQEMSRLRKENQSLQMRCDILKKALSIVSEPSGSATTR